MHLHKGLIACSSDGLLFKPWSEFTTICYSGGGLNIPLFSKSPLFKYPLFRSPLYGTTLANFSEFE